MKTIIFNYQWNKELKIFPEKHRAMKHIVGIEQHKNNWLLQSVSPQ